MLRAIVVSMCLVLAGSSTAIAQVTLEHKLPEGARYHVDLESKIEQKLTLAGMEIDSSSNTHAVTLVTVGKRDASGNITAEQQVESLQLSIGAQGNNYQFDSANPDNRGTGPLEVVRDMHKALAKRLTKITYDKSNRVEKAESDLVILGSVPDEIKNLVKDELNPEYIKRTANDEIDQVKTGSLKQGETWQRTNTVNFGAGQIMTFKTEYTYVGPIEKDGRKLEKISGKVLEVDFGLQNSPLPLTVKDSKLAATESENTILFDPERGQTVESTSKNRITGELTFTVNNNDLPAKLDLKLEIAQLIKP